MINNPLLDKTLPLRDLDLTMDKPSIDKEKLQQMAKDLDPFNPESIEKWKDDLRLFGFENLNDPFQLSKEILQKLNQLDLL